MPPSEEAFLSFCATLHVSVFFLLVSTFAVFFLVVFVNSPGDLVGAPRVFVLFVLWEVEGVM